MVTGGGRSGVTRMTAPPRRPGPAGSASPPQRSGDSCTIFPHLGLFLLVHHGVQVEKHFIVSVGTHCYLALPKGGLTEEHVMILPIGHHACQVDLPEEVAAELGKFKSALKKMYKKLGKAPVFFERNFKTQHLQIQVVPVTKDQAEDVMKVFLDSAALIEMDMNHVRPVLVLMLVHICGA